MGSGADQDYTCNCKQPDNPKLWKAIDNLRADNYKLTERLKELHAKVIKLESLKGELEGVLDYVKIATDETEDVEYFTQDELIRPDGGG